MTEACSWDRGLDTLTYPAHVTIECGRMDAATIAGLASGSCVELSPDGDLTGTLIAGGVTIGTGTVVATEHGIAFLIG